MKYTIGKYVVVPEKSFQSMDKAIQYIQGIYPELDKETIDKYLTPKVKDGDNKSGNSPKESPTSQENDSKNSSTSTKGVKSTTDKSG